GAGCLPDRLSVQGKGFGGKPVAFANGDSRLQKRGFSDVKSVSVFAIVPDGAIPTLDWWAIASLDLGVGLRPYFGLAARASVSKLDDEPLRQLTRSCISNICPKYGIGFRRKHDQGPLFYAAGVNYSSSPGQESPSAYEGALTVSRWGDLGMVEEVYKQGVLRDVYPQNYLTEPQLSRMMGRETLREWIDSESSRGMLTSLDDRMMLWTVTDSQINSIRDELWSAGAIFDWKSYLDE
ncbi:MAG: hypothetical protein ACI9HK_003542, partial [Pirellulaceae bacterium]